MKALKNFLIITCLLTCLLGASENIFAQTDYIITNDGTKIMGELKSDDVNRMKFKAMDEKKAKKFKPSEIEEAYKAGHGVFRSVLIPNHKDKCFLKVLEDGKVKLYEYYKNGGMYGAPGRYGSMYSSTKKSWYAQKDNGEVVEVKTNQIWGSRKERKDSFLNLIQDNKHIADRYQAENKFNFDFVRSLIVEYNSLSSK